MKRKLGKSLCSMLLALAMVIVLMPGMSLTAKADNTETLLTTITPTSKTTYNETTSGIVTVSHHNDGYSGGYNGGWTWYSVADTLLVSGCDGYTITKVIFKQGALNYTDSSAPFELHFDGSSMVFCRENFQMDGVTSIQVYGYANTVDTPSAAISPENSGTVSVTFDSDSNEWIFTASPAEGYVFVEWVYDDDGDFTSVDSNPLSVNPSTLRNWGNLTAVFEEAPVQTYTVTYSVVNGTWSDGTTADKTETVQSGSAPASVPSGMIAGSGFTGGSWDTDPASATITEDTTFTYTFEAIPTYTVTYSVVNGTWSDGTTADKTETVQSGSAPASVPSGMIADSGFTGGSWDTDPASATITGNITFTYTFEAESVDPDPEPEPDPVATVSMYRLYNPNSGEHFYTANAGERNHLIGLGWNDEGIGWTAPARSNTPVYRLYNQNGGEHHFTTSVAERNNLIGLGWNDEGIGWYSDDARTVPLYRQYNPNAFANNHNFTTSLAENDHLVSLGWRAEGIGWYGV